MRYTCLLLFKCIYLLFMVFNKFPSFCPQGLFTNIHILQITCRDKSFIFGITLILPRKKQKINKYHHTTCNKNKL